MKNWRVELRVEWTGWFWECHDEEGNYICRSNRNFQWRWQAYRDFELMFEDHWALMRSRFAV